MPAPNPHSLISTIISEALHSLKNSALDYLAHVRMFSRNARLYLTGSFLIAINFAIFNVLYNLYLRECDFREGDIGQILSARALGMTLMAVPAALLLSRIRLKPALLVATVLFALFGCGMAVYLDMPTLVGVALLAGMAFSISRVASGPFFMRNSTHKERTYLFSFSFAMMLLASMVGSAGSGNLVAWIGEATGDMVLGYRYTLILGILISLGALVPFALVKASDPSSEENRITLSLAQLKRRGKFYLQITFANFLIGTGAGLIIPFLNIFFRDRFQQPPEHIGWYLFAVSCSMFVGVLAGPILTRRFGLVRTIVGTQLVSIPFMVVLAYSYLLPLVVIAFVLRGGLMNLGVPISTNFGMEMSEENEQGLVNALLMASWTGSLTVSVWIGGEIIENYGYTVALNMAIILYVLSAVSYFGFFRKAERKNKHAPGWTIPVRDAL